MLKCENCGLQCNHDDWDQYFDSVDYSNFTTGYDGVRDWYEETYTLRCKNCNHDTEVTSGWVVEVDESEG